VLTNSYFIALCVPILLLLCSALAKKLVRGSGWARTDFFLGVEMALAALASGFVNFLDLSKPALASPNVSVSALKTTETAVFVVLCFFLLLWILSVHQDWEKRAQNPKGQWFWLGGVANLIGAALMVTFIVFIKGI
jgi:uncharacterized membrane protein YdcZ (DUF606 family)